MAALAIFLPGLFAGSWIWSAQIEIMRSKGFEIVVFDDPFVKFDKIYGTVPSLIDCVKETLLPHRSQEMVVFGNSMGGYIGLALARDPTFRVRQAFVSGCPGAGRT